MKRLFAAMLMGVLLCFAASAQEAQNNDSQAKSGETSENTEHEFNYVNAQVLRVFDYPDSYVIVYAKHSLGTGKVAIPKKWYKEVPRKFEMRELPHGIDPYVTYITDHGEFYKVWLTIPSNRANRVWAIGTPSNAPEANDSDSITMTF